MLIYFSCWPYGCDIMVVSAFSFCGSSLLPSSTHCIYPGLLPTAYCQRLSRSFRALPPYCCAHYDLIVTHHLSYKFLSYLYVPIYLLHPLFFVGLANNECHPVPWPQVPDMQTTQCRIMIPVYTFRPHDYWKKRKNWISRLWGACIAARVIWLPLLVMVREKCFAFIPIYLGKKLIVLEPIT